MFLVRIRNSNALIGKSVIPKMDGEITMSNWSFTSPGILDTLNAIPADYHAKIYDYNTILVTMMGNIMIRYGTSTIVNQTTSMILLCVSNVVWVELALSLLFYYDRMDGRTDFKCKNYLYVWTQLLTRNQRDRSI